MSFAAIADPLRFDNNDLTYNYHHDQAYDYRHHDFENGNKHDSYNYHDSYNDDSYDDGDDARRTHRQLPGAGDAGRSQFRGRLQWAVARHQRPERRDQRVHRHRGRLLHAARGPDVFVSCSAPLFPTWRRPRRPSFPPAPS